MQQVEFFNLCICLFICLLIFTYLLFAHLFIYFPTNCFLLQWTCSIASFTNYGADCAVFGTASTTSSIMNIASFAMSFNTTYAFVVGVSSRDGRSASQTVTVTPTSTGSAQLSITTSFTKFNSGSKLVVNGYLSATYAVTSVWSVYDTLGVPVPFTALTPITKSFTASDASAQITFPLSIAAGVFTGGGLYSFRLTAYPTSDSKSQTFTQIVLTANSPPTGGYVTALPTVGSALVTQFVVSSPGWTADAANFPLSFSFAYRLSSASTYLTLGASSLRAFTTSSLPAGLSTERNLITLQSQATDIFLSFGSATSTVGVTLSATTNVSLVLTTGLSSAFSSGNINLAFQTVNNVSYGSLSMSPNHFFHPPEIDTSH